MKSRLNPRTLRRRLVSKGLNGDRSYSQRGEDLIIDFLFQPLTIERPSYIDIRALDRSYSNHTKLRYQNGSRGINIEANPTLHKRFTRHRTRDVKLVIEGLDVLPSITQCDPTHRPKRVCIETLVCPENGPARKKTELIAQIVQLGYQVYADTHINTIFCRSDLGVFID